LESILVKNRVGVEVDLGGSRAFRATPRTENGPAPARQ
jgi:hypothetical protein